MADPLGGAPGIIVGVGVGAAASAALAPAIEIPKQEAWSRNANRILDAGLIARLVAEGAIALDFAHESAKRDGFGPDKLDALVYLAQTVPGVGEAMHLWRLGILSKPLFEHVLTKLGLDSRYVKPLINSKLAEVVGLGDVAYGVVRGILPAPSWVPVAPPASGDKVPRFPQVDIDPLVLAEKLGFDEDMLKLMVGRSGLSMAPTMAASALFRKIIGPNDYLLAIAEGDLRTEWAEAVLDTARQIPTAHTFVEGRLRGWLNDKEMNNGTARWGMSPEDTHLEFLVSGRPLSWHQVFIGIRRGGVYDGPTDVIEPPFLKALQESNIRPEWYHIAWHLRFSYPTGFMVRGAVTSGDLTPQQGNDILYELGWNQKWIDVFIKAWSGGTTTGGKELVKAELIDEFEGGFVSPSELRDHLTALGYSGESLNLEIHLADARRIKSWRDKGITALGKSYVGSKMTRDAADTYLQELQVTDPDTRSRILGIWDLERTFP